MDEIKVKVAGKEYAINNSDKYERAKREAGGNASSEKIFSIYDRLGGLIKDEHGKQIENGAFWEAYKRKEEEQPKYIKILEDREERLEESEKQTHELMLKNVDHKRAFLGTTMTIAAAVIAGLFILFTNNDLDSYLHLLAIISGLGFGFFILSSSIYLTAILSRESLSLDKQVRFIRVSKKDFIEKVGVEITDIDSYEKYREQQYKEGKKLDQEIGGSREIWFVLVNALFILSFSLLLRMFLFSI